MGLIRAKNGLSHHFCRLCAGAAVATLLAGCQSSSGPYHTGSIGSSASINSSDLTPEQAAAAVQTWGKAYSKNEKDKFAALNYAAALRASGQSGQAVAIMRKAAIYHPDDREVLAGFGKALAADSRFDEALATIQRAQRPDNPDWQLLSTEGGIRDSLNQHQEARGLYQQALVLAPGEPQVLNNLGMSYVLTNELGAAESVLRQAAASPRATLKVRENLALVLRLEGKSDGAQAGDPAIPLLVSEAPPAEQNTWKDLVKN